MSARSNASLFWLGASAGYLQIGSLLLGNVVAMGLVVRHLGADVSAAWALLYTIMSAVELTALGLGLPLVNGMARCMEDASRWAILETLLRIAGYAAICLAGALLAFDALSGGLLTELFGSVAETVPGLSTSLPWCIALAALKSAGYLATFAFTGMHEVHITRTYQAGYAVAPAIGVVVLVVADGGFWSLFVTVQIWQFVALFVVAMHLASRRRTLRSAGTPLPRLPTLGSQAARYGAVLVATQCVLASGGFVVAGIATPRDVIAYVLVWRLAAVMVALINVLPSTLWSRMAAFGENANQSESVLIARVTLATTITAAGAALVLAWHAEWLVHVWVGPNLYAGAAVAAWLGIYVLGQGVGLAALNLAFARDLSFAVVLAIVVYSAVVVMFSAVLGQRFGLNGVAFAVATITLVGYLWFAYRLPSQVGFEIGADYQKALSSQVLLATAGVLAMYLIQRTDAAFAVRMIGGMVLFLSWILIAWRVLPKTERGRINMVLSATFR